jgi:serine/threonine protein kinase
MHPRYLLEREVGRGGMATIYMARDHDTGASVAVKVMHPQLVETIGTDRFLREVDIAATLLHPRIVPLLASGGAGQLLYYIMPLVEGESLFLRLEQERRLPIGDVIQMARDVAEALEFAHQRGVLHRDIKPENIMLTGGRAVVVDFGLARAIGEVNYRRLTETGIIVGTVFYMSPEQLREDHNLDQRIDIYALGCVVYEALTGEPPFVGRSLSEIVMRILKTPVPLAGRLREDVPPSLEQAVARAMAKTASARFNSAREFAAALAE